MWYCYTFKAELLQYLKATLFDVEYTPDMRTLFNYAKNLFFFFPIKIKPK